MAKGDQIRFDVDSELKKNFQLKCVREGEKMNAVMVRLLEEWVDGENHLNAIRQFLLLLIKGERPSNAAIVEVAGHLRLKTDELLDLCDRFSSHKQPNGHD